jgi:hypothetical protein
MTSTVGWWSCQGCGIDVEIAGCDLTGFEMPCPDCGGEMTEWLRWDTGIAGPGQIRERGAGRSAA